MLKQLSMFSLISSCIFSLRVRRRRESLWSRRSCKHGCSSVWGDGRGLTKGGGKLGLPAFFSFKAVTTEKKDTQAVWAGSAYKEGNSLYSWWCCDNLSTFLFHPFPPLFFYLHTQTAHVCLIDMMISVHLRTFIFLVVSKVLIVTCQDVGGGKSLI